MFLHVFRCCSSIVFARYSRVMRVWEKKELGVSVYREIVKITWIQISVKINQTLLYLYAVIVFNEIGVFIRTWFNGVHVTFWLVIFRRIIYLPCLTSYLAVFVFVLWYWSCPSYYFHYSVVSFDYFDLDAGCQQWYKKETTTTTPGTKRNRLPSALAAIDLLILNVYFFLHTSKCAYHVHFKWRPDE